jgi:hypothetical protein
MVNRPMNMNELTDDSQVFQPLLEPEEKLLWSGRPGGAKLVLPSDLIRIIFGLIAIILPLAILTRPLISAWLNHEPIEPFEYFLLAPVAVFIAVGVNLGFGGLIKRRKITRAVRYAITDKRVIIADARDPGSPQALLLRDIKGLTLKTGKERAGTIVFGEIDPGLWFTISETPDDLADKMPDLLYLFEIPEAEQVRDLLSRLMTENAPPADDSEPPAPEPQVTEEDAAALSGLEHSPPPRQVQPALALIALVGNGLFQFGVVWMGFCFIFLRLILILDFNIFPVAARFLDTEKTSAVITGLKISGNISINHGPSAPDKGYTYRFTDRSGKTRTAVYHSFGGPYKIGDRVPIAYVVSHPGISRIVDLDPALPFWVMVLLLIFPVVGLAILAGGLGVGRNTLRLLRLGEAAVGRFAGKDFYRPRTGPRSTRVALVCRLAYTFRASDGEIHKIYDEIPTKFFDLAKAEKRFNIEVPLAAYVLYDPTKPAKAQLARRLPGHPKFDLPGQVYSGRPAALIGWLLPTALVLAGHLLGPYLFWKLVEMSI